MNLSKKDAENQFDQEVLESFDDILQDGSNYRLSLSKENVEFLFSKLNDNSLQNIMSSLLKIVIPDLVDLIKYISKNSKFRDILFSISVNGIIDKKYIDKKINNYLYSEIKQQKNKTLIDLNKQELVINLLTLRYHLQKLLISEYKKEFKSAEEFLFDDIEIDNYQKELRNKIDLAKQTKIKTDDYLAEFNFGFKELYEAEQLYFLGEKTKEFAKKENIELPDSFNKRFSKLLDASNKILAKYDLERLSFSFHKVKLLGSIYNFGYFSEDAYANDFFVIPKLSSKPVVILLHGMFLDWACWRPMIKLLKKDFQIIVPDMNGYGDSEELKKFHNFDNFSEYIIKFVEALNIKEYSVIGHSAGGFTIQQLIQTRSGNKPSKAVIISSGVQAPKSFVASIIVGMGSKLRAQGLFGAVFVRYPKRIKWVFGRYEKIYSRKYLVSVLQKASLRTISETIQHIILDYNISDKIINTTTKVLVVYGGKDTRVNPTYSKELLKVFPNSQELFIPYAGHSNIIKLIPEEYSTALLKFLES